MDSTIGSKIFMIMRSAIALPNFQLLVCPLYQQESGHSLRRTAALLKTTVVVAATAPAPALALWLASPAALTRAYAQGWQPAAVAD
jgi:hypothetical protein